MGNRTYPFLDGFRAIAVLGVLLTHGGTFLKIETGIFSLGYLGVDMFFVISGFLITGILIEDWDGIVDVKRFYLRRFLKIIPSYLALLFITLIVHKQGIIQNQEIKGGDIINYLFFIQNYFPKIPTLAHTWSLAVEEHFYLFYPLVIYTIFSIAKTANARRLTMMSFCLVFMIFVITNRHLYHGQGILSVMFNIKSSYQATLFRIDALVFGCLLRFLEPYYEIKNDWPFTKLLCFIAGIGIYIYFFVAGLFNHWDPFLLGYLAPGFLLLAAYKNFQPFRLFMEIDWLRFIGKSSYGIYLWHYLIVLYFKSLVSYMGPVLAFLSYLGISVSAGILSTITIERYFLNLRKKIAA